MKITSIVFCFLTLILSGCKQTKVFAVFTGKIVDPIDLPLDSVLYEVFINGHLKKAEKYGDTMFEYKNDKQIREFINGLNFTDSLGQFAVTIMEEIDPQSEIMVKFIKDGYESFSVSLDKSITLDTSLQMQKLRAEINSKSKIDELIASIDGNDNLKEGIAEGPMVRGDSTIGGWDEYNALDRETESLGRIKTSFYSDTSDYYRFYYKEQQLYYSEHLKTVYKNKKTDTLSFEIIYSISDSIILNQYNSINPEKLIQFGMTKIDQYKR